MSEKERPPARYLRSGEMVALDTGALRSGPAGFFWLFGPSSPRNDRRGDVAIVHVRGPLDHHSDAFDDNYESILCRLEEAFSGDDARKAHDREHRWDDGYEPAVAEVPSAVILCIDSPGGVVSGLNETVKSIQKMRKAAGIPLVAYVNEMSASAAYALACACDKIYAPKSAILGSVGVISTMISQDAKNKKDGFEVRLITSGARKADGHVHAPISDAAVDVESGRVEKLALDFFKLVAKSRGISVDRVASFQAGIFLGADAKKRGLSDGVCSFDECVASLSKGKSGPSAADEDAAKGNETDRRATRVPKTARSGASSKKRLDSGKKSSSVRHTLARSGTHPVESERMSSKSILALIKKQEAAIAKELASKADPEKLAALYADLSAYKKTEKHVEHTKSEEYDDEDDDEEGDEDDDEEDDEDEKKSSKSSKAESEEDDDEEEEESKKSKKAKAARPSPPLAALAASIGVPVASLTPGKLKAVFEQAAQFATLSTDVATLKATQTKATKNALIDEAVAQRRITRKQAATLRDKKLGFVNDYLAMHKTALVNIDEDALLVPDSATNADVPANVRALVEQAISLNGLKGEDADKFRAQAYEDQRKASGMPDGRH